jgi:hypothetical protein
MQRDRSHTATLPMLFPQRRKSFESCCCCVVATARPDTHPPLAPSRTHPHLPR